MQKKRKVSLHETADEHDEVVAQYLKSKSENYTKE